jgi:nucleoside-diphosphate-sugar epimerase
MKLLVIGGSGNVGSMVVPALAATHDVRVFDLKPPRSEVDYVTGNIGDFAAIRSAIDDRDALVYMAMGPLAGFGEPDNAAAHFDVAVKGLYLALRAANDAGIDHAVFTSSMSVFHESFALKGMPTEPYPDESVPPNSTNFYGLAKRSGEEVCRAAVAEYGMSVVALRLCHPVANEEWPPERPDKAAFGTSGRDTADAILRALEYRGHGFEPFGISGDATGRYVSTEKARRVLGWSPQDPITPR